MKTPSRGDIWFVNLNPVMGREQQGLRPVLVVSEREFNQLGLSVMCPITQGGQQSRFAGFAVTLTSSGSETQGLVMCNQPRTVVVTARVGRFVETVNDDILAEVMARLQTIFESNF